METDQPKPNRDFLLHLESYLSKRDGVDKLLKITRYTTKLIISTNLTTTTHHRLKTFESTVGLSRKAFRIVKFIQPINSFRSAKLDTVLNLTLAFLAYGGEGLYYFVEQFVWLVKSGLFGDKQLLRKLELVSAWAELVGYVGTISLKIRDLKVISVGIKEKKDEEELRKLREKKFLKWLSVVQDLADGFMAVGDVSEGKGRFSGPVLMALAGLLSAVISTHKNWLSC